MQIKNLAIWIVSSVCVLAFIILLSFSVYSLYRTIVSSGAWSSDNSDPYAYASCEKLKDNNFSLPIFVSTSGKEIKNVKCDLLRKGGMASDKESISIPFIQKNSSSLCEFLLNGEPVGNTEVKISYSMKKFWGRYEEYSILVTPSPSCFEVANPSQSEENVY